MGEKVKNLIKNIWEVLDDFFSVRSFITIGAFGIAYWLIYKGKPVPEQLAHIIDLLLGYWFGSKIAKLTNKEVI